MGIYAHIIHRVSRRSVKPDFGFSRAGKSPLDRKISKLVITGASGSVATAIRPMLSDTFDEIVLTDLEGPVDLRHNESFVAADLNDLEHMTSLCEGADAILHLGGISEEAVFDKLNGPNIRGTYNVFEAARLNGIRRVTFASSLHTLGFYRRTEGISEFSPTRPDSLYAATKLFGEAVGYVYAQKYGIKTVCIRIGAVGADARSVEPGSWIGAHDLANMIVIALTHPGIEFEIFHGLSNHRKAPWRKLRARLFGYRPSIANESYPASVERAKCHWPEDNIAAKVRGTTFAAQNFNPKVNRPPKQQ